jgi:hypothetical protein
VGAPARIECRARGGEGKRCGRGEDTGMAGEERWPWGRAGRLEVGKRLTGGPHLSVRGREGEGEVSRGRLGQKRWLGRRNEKGPLEKGKKIKEGEERGRLTGWIGW